jgi:tetratricopeptide (TPR) repeat protein
LEKLKYNLARVQFQKCIDLNPTFHTALIGMANIAYNEYLYDKAEHYLRQAIVIEPNDNQAVIMMGNVMMATKVKI